MKDPDRTLKLRSTKRTLKANAMPDNQQPPKTPLAYDLAGHVGPVFGCIMGLCYSAAYVLLFLKDRDLSDAAQVFFGLGFAAAAVGLGRAIRHVGSLVASTQAENRIDNNHLPSSSVIPEVQSQIDIQKAEAYKQEK